MSRDPIHNPIQEDVVYADPPRADATSATTRAAGAKAGLVADAMQRKVERERNDLSQVLHTTEGQAVILRILDHCRPYAMTISSEPSQYGLNEGRRSVGLWIIDQITRVDPLLYPHLLVEHVKRQTQLANVEAGISMAR